MPAAFFLGLLAVVEHKAAQFASGRAGQASGGCAQSILVHPPVVGDEVIFSHRNKLFHFCGRDGNRVAWAIPSCSSARTFPSNEGTRTIVHEFWFNLTWLFYMKPVSVQGCSPGLSRRGTVVSPACVLLVQSFPPRAASPPARPLSSSPV